VHKLGFSIAENQVFRNKFRLKSLIWSDNKLCMEVYGVPCMKKSISSAIKTRLYFADNQNYATNLEKVSSIGFH
jgi:hypothetical protein